jgi:hypothetical protein
MNDDRLRELLTDAVSDVEPEDRIEELRATVRPAPRVVRVLHTRPWYAAAAIVAGVIGVVAYVTAVAGDDSAGPGFATHGGTSGPPTAIATDTAAPSTSPSTSPRLLTVYYLGPGPRGDVLFRERVAAGQDPLQTAVAALSAEPRDPDYRTEWLAGSLLRAHLKHGNVEVELGAMRSSRPHAMSARTAEEIVQQAVYTFQAASGLRDAKVQFLRHDKPARTVLGVSTNHPLAPARATDVLSLMNITSPTEGQVIGRGTFVVTGLNNSPESNVEVKLVRSDPSGDTTVLTAAGAASGTGDLDRLYPWRVSIDTTALPSGSYTLVASNGQMASEGEGLPPAIDTRMIVLR